MCEYICLNELAIVVIHSFYDLVFVRTKQYDILAGVLLAVTGCEAMFAK